jgi:arabinan endo-1,5-alpha-L-arabinosidase
MAPIPLRWLRGEPAASDRHPVNRRALVVTLATVLAAVTGIIGFLLISNRGSHDAPVATYRNPVYHHDAPDPSIIRAPSGTFYAYTTQSPYASGLVNIPMLRSKDLVHWKFVGDAFPKLPNWVGTDMWAPHVTRFNGQYYMYFSGRNAFTGNMNIGVATASGPTGPWRDMGHPLIQGRFFTTIDPFVLNVSATKRYLVWGSAGVPIKAQRLARNGMSLMGRVTPLVHPDPNRLYHVLLEGAWIVHHDGYYYLLASGDACCDESAFYAVMAWRSKAPLGPYKEDPTNPILELNKHFTAPGHNSTITDDAGQMWMLYHAILPDDPLFFRDLFIDRVDWRGGWPVVNGGEGPSWKPQPVPMIKSGLR